MMEAEWGLKGAFQIDVPDLSTTNLSIHFEEIAFFIHGARGMHAFAFLRRWADEHLAMLVLCLLWFIPLIVSEWGHLLCPLCRWRIKKYHQCLFLSHHLFGTHL